MADKALPWDHPLNAKARSDATATKITQPSLTQLSMQEQSDINWIVRNFMPEAIPLNRRPPMEGDFTGINDFRGALEAVRNAEDAFLNLPAPLRQELNNDPAAFVEWCQDEKNQDAMIKYGLATDTRPKPTTTDALKEAAAALKDAAGALKPAKPPVPQKEEAGKG